MLRFLRGGGVAEKIRFKLSLHGQVKSWPTRYCSGLFVMEEEVVRVVRHSFLCYE